MPTICLTMIVKDEGHLIRDTLKHLLTYIRFDSWCICDTGSTDNTIQEIEEFFSKEGIPGAIHRHEWKDFGHNRTLAFNCAYNVSDYAFVWDADDEIVGDFKLPAELTADWYRFTFGARGCTQYRRCQLFNNRKKWKYVGVLHECPACCETCGSPEDVLGDYHFVSGRRGARNKDPKKYHKDAMILDRAYHEALEAKDDMYKRYCFYCAQSYLCAGDREKAVEFYKKVLAIDTWSQEQYISCLEIYDAYEHLGKAKEGLFYLVEGFRYDSQRAECVLRLVKYYVNANLPQVALLYYRGIQEYYENQYATDTIEEKLFVRRCDPDFYLPYYMIIVAERTKNLDLCAKMFDAILSYKYMGVTAWWIQNAFHNLQFFIKHIPKTVKYVQKIISYLDLAKSHGILLQDAQNTIIQGYLRSCEESLCRPRELPPKSVDRINVMLTMTTCKRLDLFQKTVRSILTTWTDIEEVDFFFCVDDASSTEDRNAMTTEFPFFTFYMKKAHERGHRESMNIIWNKLAEVKPKYWIHLEDDWLFFRKRAYVADSINFLTRYKDQNIHQILFNRNYAETFNDWGINGGIPLEPGFFVHDTAPVEGRNCAYWKHYSFRPSMIRVETILGLGDYTTPNTFFEGDYAQRYSGKGYRSAFFDTISCLHIGKLTSDKGGVNAYTLNNVSQFKDTKPNTYIVNLERRPDRKKAMEDLFEAHGIESYSFFKAVDGKTLVVTEEIVKLFTGNDFNSRHGFIGCALSHYRLWKQLEEDPVNEYYIVYEDDITLCEDYKKKLEGVLLELEGKDVVFLGFHVFNKDSDKKYIRAEGLLPTDKKVYIGGTFSYIITKSGCKKLLSYIHTKGIKHGIDYLMNICEDLVTCNPQPHLVFSEWVETVQSSIDTDIQRDYSSLELVIADSKDDWVFYPGVDSGDNDICSIPGKRVDELYTLASLTEGCVAFNSLGFLKHKVVLPFKRTPYINTTDKGLYVKKGYLPPSPADNATRVKMLCNWCSSEELCVEWSKMSKGDNRWNSIQLTSEDTNIDYYVIINKPRAGDVFVPEKTIIFHMEPWCGEEWQTWGVKTWGEWARPDPAKFLQVRSHDSYINTAFWQINKTYTELQGVITKDEDLEGIVSSICSSKYFDPGHKKRIDFMKFIESKGDVQLHIFNDDNKHRFASYKGTARPSIDKEKGILPYKYYFMCENNVEKNFITEKLWEPILCETLCFYWGCPNVSDYINPLAYVQLDMDDFEGSYQLMVESIRDNLWEKRLEVIREEKKKVLEKYNFFPTLESVILESKKTVCFIHSCHLASSGTATLDHLLENVLSQKEIDKIYIHNIGLRLPAKYTDPRISIRHESDNPGEFELPTLRRLSEFSKRNPRAKILYLHTKGISYSKDDPVYSNVQDWINYMLHFLCQVPRCTDALESHDTAGCNRSEKPHDHYSGNFWWATANYINTLSLDSLVDKMSAEWWILSGKANAYTLEYSFVNHYHESYPKERYSST